MFRTWLIQATMLLLSAAGLTAQENPSTFDVRQFGARGDGTSDDTAAFQRASMQPARRAEVRCMCREGTIASPPR